MAELKEYLNAINYTKENLMDEANNPRNRGGIMRKNTQPGLSIVHCILIQI